MFASVFKLNIKGKTSLKKTQFVGRGGEKLGFGIGMLGIAFNFNYDQNSHKNEEVNLNKNRATQQRGRGCSASQHFQLLAIVHKKRGEKINFSTGQHEDF